MEGAEDWPKEMERNSTFERTSSFGEVGEAGGGVGNLTVTTQSIRQQRFCKVTQKDFREYYPEVYIPGEDSAVLDFFTTVPSMSLQNDVIYMATSQESMLLRSLSEKSMLIRTEFRKYQRKRHGVNHKGGDRRFRADGKLKRALTLDAIRKPAQDIFQGIADDFRRQLSGRSPERNHSFKNAPRIRKHSQECQYPTEEDEGNETDRRDAVQLTDRNDKGGENQNCVDRETLGRGMLSLANQSSNLEADSFSRAQGSVEYAPTAGYDDVGEKRGENRDLVDWDVVGRGTLGSALQMSNLEVDKLSYTHGCVEDATANAAESGSPRNYHVTAGVVEKRITKESEETERGGTDRVESVIDDKQTSSSTLCSHYDTKNSRTSTVEAKQNMASLCHRRMIDNFKTENVVVEEVEEELVDERLCMTEYSRGIQVEEAMSMKRDGYAVADFEDETPLERRASDDLQNEIEVIVIGAVEEAIACMQVESQTHRYEFDYSELDLSPASTLPCAKRGVPSLLEIEELVDSLGDATDKIASRQKAVDRPRASQMAKKLESTSTKVTSVVSSAAGKEHMQSMKAGKAKKGMLRKLASLITGSSSAEMKTAEVPSLPRLSTAPLRNRRKKSLRDTTRPYIPTPKQPASSPLSRRSTNNVTAASLSRRKVTNHHIPEIHLNDTRHPPEPTNDSFPKPRQRLHPIRIGEFLSLPKKQKGSSR